MGKISTTDKIESQQTGKLYIDKEFYKYLPIANPIPKRCTHCKTILLSGMPYGYTRIGYCGEWCHEMENPPTGKSHECKACGKAVSPFRRTEVRNGKEYEASSGVYPKYCRELKCINERKNKSRIKKNQLKNIRYAENRNKKICV